MQNALNNLLDWANKWQMEFNPGKCKVVHFGRSNPNINYFMNGTVVGKSDCEKDIGVYVSKDNKPSIHCSKVAAKENVVLGMMARGFHYRDKHTWIKLYKVYVRPHLEFASPAWNPWLQKDIDTLEKVQKRAVNMCSGLTGQSYDQKLRELGLDSLYLRRKKADLIMVWKVIHKYDDIRESDIFDRLTMYTQRDTRASADPLNLRTSLTRLDIRKNFFTNKVIREWNALPLDIKSIPKLDAFKTKLNSLVIS